MRLFSTSRERFVLDRQEIEEVDQFCYLGSLVNKQGGASEDVKSRVKKANGAFVQLYPLWRSHNIS
jgi:hypothetical protein